MFIYPYKFGSRSARALGKRIRHRHSRFRPLPDKTIVNWGASEMPEPLMVCRVLNTPDRVKAATNKLEAFRLLKEGGVSVPPFTTDQEVANEWRRDSCVVCRTLLRGSSGRGIVLADEDNVAVDAPLYVKYIPKRHEYRVHVIGGEAVFTQRKARRMEVEDEDVNWKIRNHDNGFIYAHQDVQCPDDVLEESVKAVAVLGLDFGAVDVIWNGHYDKAFILEVNTAPGLEGATLEVYQRELGRM
jgi:glutathione synthase/RimK-type ligase-like ATP-grasp enzyme